jgi:ketosteroid isomerase-like protein
MSQDNIALVRGLYEAFGRGDVPTVLAGFADDIEWNEAEGMPYGGQYHGPNAVAENVFAPITDDFNDFAVTPEELFADGDTVVTIARYTGTAKESGKALDLQAAHAWNVRDGKIARFRLFGDATVVNAALAVEATA